MRRYSQGSVRGYVHEPSTGPTGSLVLTHGAGLNCDSPLLIALANSFSEGGLVVLRCDLAFRQKRSVGPPFSAGAQADRDGLREAVQQVSTFAPFPLFLGGHSYGGRQASILMTEENPPSVMSLLLLSFPLHPPRKPEQLRSSHFPELRTPAFFFHGTRDSFGSPEEMEAAMELLPESTPHVLLLAEGAGHELSNGGDRVVTLCRDEFLHFAAKGRKTD